MGIEYCFLLSLLSVLVSVQGWPPHYLYSDEYATWVGPRPLCTNP